MELFLCAWLTVAILFTGVAAVRLVLRRQVEPRGRRGASADRAGVDPLPMNGQPGGSAAVGRRGLLLRPLDFPSVQELRNLALRVEGIDSLVVSGVAVPGVEWFRSDPTTANRKLGHLQHALSRPSTVPVLIADADVRVDAALVDALLAGLEAGADLAWAASRPERGIFARGLLVQSLHSFEALDVLSRGGPRPICGKAFALSPRAIEVFCRLPDCLGEDLQLAAQLHALKLEVRLVADADLPRSPAPFARFTRWMQVLRAHRPALFPTIPILFACTPILLAAAAIDRSPTVLGLTTALVLSRMILAAILERRPGLYFSWLAAEGMLGLCWVNAVLRGARVVWRDRILIVGRGGRLGAGG